MVKNIFKFIKWIFIILLLIFFVAFCISNNEIVTVSLFPLPFEADIRLFLLIIFSIFIGIFITACLNSFKAFKGVFKYIKEKSHTKKLNKKIENLEKENTNLKKEGGKNE
jgi:uncharacterized integral membrane protein